MGQGPSVVDNMVLGRFVDADQLPLLAALAGGVVHVPPTIVDPLEVPPYSQQPLSEFARGIFIATRTAATDEKMETRVRRRAAFLAMQGTHWRGVAPTPAELALAKQLAAPTTLAAVRAALPRFKGRKVDGGEAECAAVAISRGWTLWTDDTAIIAVMTTHYSAHRVERVSDLLMRAVAEGRIDCQAAADLYNEVFMSELGLWSRVRLRCAGGQLVAR